MNFDVPAGLTDLLQNFTISVLRERPDDLYKFAAEYFQDIESRRQGRQGSKKGVSFESGRSSDIVDYNRPLTADDSEEEFIEPPKTTYKNRRKSVSAEGYDPEADKENYSQIVIPKSEEQRERLGEVLKHIFIFRTIDSEQVREVLDAMFERRVEVGEHIIDQGDDGDNFYVIDSGHYDIFLERDNGHRDKVGSYDNQGSFGELALMYNMPRAATIVATTKGSLWAMDRLTFRRIILKNAFNKRKMYESLLENVPMLKELNPYERMNVADALQSKSYASGQQIIKQGDTADCMYFIESGEVRCMVREKADGPEVEVSRCHNGQYFGELALITHRPRAASVYCVTQVKVAVLDIEAFERLLGPCMEIMKRNIHGYENQLESIFGSKHNIPDLR